MAEAIEVCGKCAMFKRHPNNPSHASHYVSCAWLENTPLPQYVSAGETLPLMPFTAGQNCKAFIATKELQK